MYSKKLHVVIGNIYVTIQQIQKHKAEAVKQFKISLKSPKLKLCDFTENDDFSGSEVTGKDKPSTVKIQ